MMRKPLLVMIFPICLAVAGCANQLAVYRNRPLALGPNIVTVDARQRNIISGDRSKDWASCAEAAPDVFVVASTGAAADIAVQQANPEQRARASLAIAETGASIERTQTVNLLRESMFRTCERFLSGAIGPSELVVQAARDQRGMVAILAIEQLTRTVWPKTTIINSGAASSSVRDPSAYLDAVANASREATKAKIVFDSADTAYVLMEEGKCPTLQKPAPTADAVAQQLWLDCEAAKTRRSSAEINMKVATDVLKEMRGAGANTDLATGLGATAGQGASSNIVQVAANEADISKVADAVQQIVKMNYDFNEIEMLCVRVILDSGSKISPIFVNAELMGRCLALVTGRADQQLKALVGP